MFLMTTGHTTPHRVNRRFSYPCRCGLAVRFQLLPTIGFHHRGYFWLQDRMTLLLRNSEKLPLTQKRGKNSLNQA